MRVCWKNLKSWFLRARSLWANGLRTQRMSTLTEPAPAVAEVSSEAPSSLDRPPLGIQHSDTKIYLECRRVKDSQLREKFSPFGDIHNIQIKANCSFVEFRKSVDAKAALDKLGSSISIGDQSSIRIKPAYLKKASTEDGCHICHKPDHWQRCAKEAC
jgi:hypothetical protein